MKHFPALSLLVLLLPLTTWAHKPSDSYLTLDLRGPTVQGQWDIALRDLAYVIGLDRNTDGAISWGELRAQHAEIASYALAHLQLSTDAAPCTLLPGQQLVDQHSDGAYTVLPFSSDCSARQVQDNGRLHYQLFFELDPSHRGLVQLIYPSTVQSVVLSPTQPDVQFQPDQASRWRQFSDYWREGVWHIWIGFDHILFLLALLLPSVLWRTRDGWCHAVSFRRVALDICAVVTAFTLAHSITLSAAALGWVSLPTRWVETAIALTVLLAALNNLWPVVHARRWLLAFALGLIHGFGFAAVLADLGLPAHTLALALLGFNLGVEGGQLLIVLFFLPLAYALRATVFYRRAIMQLGSLLMALLALLWLLQRSVLTV